MGGGGGDKCYTAGYRYYTGLQLIFCHFTDKVLQIGVGDKIAWSGSVTDNTTISIAAPDLFGGEDREGGVVGAVDVCFGGATQPCNPYLQSILGAAIPAFRGLFSLVANHCMVACNNPYIKQWWVLAQRTRIGWRDDLADIIADDGYLDMNPAHIIRDALTNTEWGGLGYPTSDLNESSFAMAANILQAEGFGLSLIWAKNTSIDDFIALVLNHINGVYYFSHDTGLLTLKLIRADSSIGGLPVLNKSNILSLDEFIAPSSVDVINQVTINYVDRDNKTNAVTVQDLAGTERMGGQINCVSLNMPGISNATIANRVAARELAQLCSPIATCSLTINRVHSDLNPGDCFTLEWLPLGINGMVFRVASVDIGEHSSNSLVIKAVRDVFGFANYSFTTPVNSLWTNPIHTPADALYRRLIEVHYWQFVREYSGESSTILTSLVDSSTFITAVCGRPAKDALNYEMWDRVQGASEWVKKDTDSFPYIGTLRMAITPEITSVLALSEVIDTNLVLSGTYAMLESEMVGVVSIDTTNRTVTVKRGILDTVPVSHSVGAHIWFYQGLYGLDTEERAVGEVVEVKLLPATSLGRLLIEDAATNTITCAGRIMRPYPPGNVRINTLRWPVSIGASDAFTLDWSHRDRTTQTVTFNQQDEGNIGPEAGVTYTLRLYGEDSLLKKTITGLSSTTYTWSSEVADCGLGRLNTSVRFELESVRGSLVSYTKWDIITPRV